MRVRVRRMDQRTMTTRAGVVRDGAWAGLVGWGAGGLAGRWAPSVRLAEVSGPGGAQASGGEGTVGCMVGRVDDSSVESAAGRPGGWRGVAGRWWQACGRLAGQLVGSTIGWPLRRHVWLACGGTSDSACDDLLLPLRGPTRDARPRLVPPLASATCRSGVDARREGARERGVGPASRHGTGLPGPRLGWVPPGRPAAAMAQDTCLPDRASALRAAVRPPEPKRGPLLGRRGPRRPGSQPGGGGEAPSRASLGWLAWGGRPGRVPPLDSQRDHAVEVRSFKVPARMRAEQRLCLQLHEDMC